jgi:alkaline phosphatase
VSSKLESILKWAKEAGKSTGIVTTTRVTHATPSAAYASIYDREMEAFDGKNFRQEHHDMGCRDIADQFLEHSKLINVSEL